VPKTAEARHLLVTKLREDAYKKLCDAVYKHKGYTPDAIPLPEILEKFDLLDEQAVDLLREFGLLEKKRRLSN
jgi:hypothetical protein